MTDKRGQDHYQAFLLRFWSEPSSDPAQDQTWRFSLEDPQTREKHAFSGLEALMSFLQARLEKGEDDKKAESVHLNLRNEASSDAERHRI